MNRPLSRRSLLQCVTLATAVVVARRPSAAESAKLDVNDPAASKLGYVEDAAQVDTKKFPGFVSGSNCENCLQLQGPTGLGYRPCAIFPGKLVAVKGWCSGWTAQM